MRLNVEMKERILSETNNLYNVDVFIEKISSIIDFNYELFGDLIDYIEKLSVEFIQKINTYSSDDEIFKENETFTKEINKVISLF